MTQTKNNKPAHTIRYGGVHVAIWPYTFQYRLKFFDVTAQRRYRIKGTEIWESTTRFRADDLLVLAKALTEAHTWINAQDREVSSSPTPAEEDAA